MLDGKRILVTGGTRGIGAAIARRAAAAGADVAITGRDEAAAGLVLEAVRGCGRNAVFIPADFAEPQSAADAVARCTDALGGLDVLVNNAAISLRRDLTDATVEDWHAILDVNLLAPYFAARSAAERFGSSGVIINISSEMGHLANPLSIPYGVTKAALLHLTKGLAIALASRNIRVVAVNPGPVRTEMLEASALKIAPDLETGLAKHASRVPLGRVGLPDEIADTIVFLASDKANFITGAILAIDGGTTIPSG